VQVVQGSKMMEGGGVRICRTVGTGQLRNLDPFLMLVCFGFCSHTSWSSSSRVILVHLSVDSAACSNATCSGHFQNHLIAMRSALNTKICCDLTRQRW